MKFMVAVRHADGKKNAIEVDNVASHEAARAAVHEAYPGSKAILVGIECQPKVTITEKVPA